MDQQQDRQVYTVVQYWLQQKKGGRGVQTHNHDLKGQKQERCVYRVLYSTHCFSRKVEGGANPWSWPDQSVTRQTCLQCCTVLTATAGRWRGAANPWSWPHGSVTGAQAMSPAAARQSVAGCRQRTTAAGSPPGAQTSAHRWVRHRGFNVHTMASSHHQQ